MSPVQAMRLQMELDGVEQNARTSAGNGHSKLGAEHMETLDMDLSAERIQKLLDDLHAEHSTTHHGDHSTTWKVTKKDKEDMEKVLDLVNGRLPKTGAFFENMTRRFFGETEALEFGWTSQPANHWYFPYTRNTAQELPTGALALHMIHRHGMGPLLLSKHQDDFASLWETSGGNRTTRDFTRVLESADVVQKLTGLMRDMSLDGLRNVHSFDHAWSVRKGSGNGCSGRSPQNCMLQASFSKPTIDLMKQYGFTDTTYADNQEEYRKYISEISSLGNWAHSNNVSDETKARLKSDRLKLWSFEDADFFHISAQ